MHVILRSIEGGAQARRVEGVGLVRAGLQTSVNVKGCRDGNAKKCRETRKHSIQQ